MEASVAIVQLRQSALSDDTLPSPHHYDVLVLDEPSKPSTSYAIKNGEQQSYITTRSTVGNHSIGSTVITLPSFKITDASLSLSESVLECLATKTRKQFRRAVPIPLFDDRPMSRADIQPGTVLMCAPVLPKDQIQYPYGRLENLARLVNMCLNTPELMDVQTRHMLLRMDEWLAHSQRSNPHFLASLFVRPPSRARVIHCAHNPAYVGEDLDKCIRYLKSARGGGSAHSVVSSIDLDEKVRVGNKARVEMMRFDKYDAFVMNPLFGWMSYKEDQVPPYFAAGSRCARGPQSANKTEEWSRQFPLHRAALTGDHKTIEKLIALRLDVNAPDGDTWTPLHYAAFYGHHKAVESLLTTGAAQVNIRIRGGATALHMAAVQGSVYLVELMLSHPEIDTEILNNEGRRALDLCQSMPKKHHMEVAKLLTEWKPLDKIQVEFVSAGNAMVHLPQRQMTTVSGVLKQIGQEYGIAGPALELFALWTCSDSLSLQLKSDWKAVERLDAKKWRSNLSKWTTHENSQEKPKLFFRRNAHAALAMEKGLMSSLPDIAITLLYDEARIHYLQGKYPCEKSDVIHLSAIIWKMLHGDGTKIGERSNISLILPGYLLNKEKVADWKTRINRYLKDSKHTNAAHLQREFLAICQQFKVYGSTFFAAETYFSKPFVSQERVWCGVNDYGLHLISRSSHTMMASYEFKILRWEYNTGSDYLSLRVRAYEHELSLRTKQASHISSLLTKLSGKH